MPPATADRTARASAPGTCGELAQGLIDGVVCMVTCPVDLHSTATVQLRPGDGLVAGPADSPKAAQAVRATLEYLGEAGLDVRLELESPLPRGKGMASSTADVSASIAATAAAAGRDLTPAEIAGIALGVEPSDGVMFPGIVLFDHRQGGVLRPLGDPPPTGVVVLDFGGTVDTLEFNRGERKAALARQSPRMEEAVSLIAQGMSCSDIELVGRGATVSSIANQEILPNPHLDAVLELAQAVGAVGVNVAHSGTVIGLLLPDDDQLADAAARKARRRFPCLESVWTRRIVSGGVRLL